MSTNTNRPEQPTTEPTSATKVNYFDSGTKGVMRSGAFITPENVTMLVSLISATAGITTAAVKGIQLWVEERKSRKIRVKCKDIEIEISGAMTEADILQKLHVFDGFRQKIEEKEVSIVFLDGKKTKHSFQRTASGVR